MGVPFQVESSLADRYAIERESGPLVAPIDVVVADVLAPA